jgi:hypothetical protein
MAEMQLGLADRSDHRNIKEKRPSAAILYFSPTRLQMISVVLVKMWWWRVSENSINLCENKV